jgi:NTP pyrophosphatase (non-canonical NTP hydrolase)
MKAKYLRDDFASVLAHAVEECGEFIAAAGKTQRWGRKSFNPELPENQRETNEAWLRRELADVRLSLARLEMALDGGLTRELDRSAA